MTMKTYSSALFVTRTAFLASLLFLAGMPASQASVTYTSGLCGSGFGNIPDYDSVGSVPGSFACVIQVSDPGVISLSNLLTVSLIGLQHEASGDLIATLTHFADVGLTGLYGPAQTIFSRIGKTSNDPNDFGYAAMFGVSPTGAGDNYDFNSTFSGDLWTEALSQGSSGFISGVAAGSTGYWTTDGFSSAANSLSSAFALQPVAGYWVLNITDNAPGPFGVPGSLSQWSFTLNDNPSSVPEPGTGLLLAAVLAAGLAIKQKG